MTTMWTMTLYGMVYGIVIVLTIIFIRQVVTVLQALG
jgi:hypothetical protein